MFYKGILTLYYNYTSVPKKVYDNLYTSAYM